jgi:uncharacterized membrane protein YhaH (DUF805 family)
MNWYLAVLRKYAVFTGRARRKEYWGFALINFIITIVLVAISGMSRGSGLVIILSLVVLLYSLAIIVPSVAVAVRRLHDIDMSGWWMLIGFVPVIGGIALLVLTVLDSNPGENRYGPNPKNLSLGNGMNGAALS